MGEMMTKETYKKLKEKLEALKKRRGIISKAIGEAREHGDLKENSAYHAAKDEQGLNEMRIREMEAKIESATVVDEMPRGDGVRVGSTVKIQAEDSERVMQYTIVPETEAAPAETPPAETPSQGAAQEPFEKPAPQKTKP